MPSASTRSHPSRTVIIESWVALQELETGGGLVVELGGTEKSHLARWFSVKAKR